MAYIRRFRSAAIARRAGAAVAVVVLLGLSGCQSFAPRTLAGGEDKRAVKLAKADPFPSPADVGLQPDSSPQNASP